MNKATVTPVNDISVITATYNAMENLPALVESLRQQTEKKFEWIVIDGASTDGTVEYLETIIDLDLKVWSAADFGIYDALNRGVQKASGQYYLVAGADDLFYPNAIADFAAALSSDPDMVTASIMVDDKVVLPGRGPSWLYGMAKFVSGHAVGTLIKRSLHDRFGYYSSRFPIAADQLFIKKCAKAGAKIKVICSIVGRYGSGGFSAADVIGAHSEFFRVQLLTEKYKFPQLLFYITRLIRHSSKF